ncbi:peptidase C45 [Gordonia spumicola]|uniref:Peptidase C45 n=1 Tax=Gordonia spumicola TaxID=589161 RepID=A0A7I9V561_9ACTN|nr:C45 family peptidase [Gordonia spumicola]GEE00151.1 peptidase C45 [Gordonia spumicola]
MKRPHVVVDSDDPAERGRQRGRALRAVMSDASVEYRRLFDALGVSTEQIDVAVAETARALTDWRPDVFDELEGIARGAEIGVDEVLMLNARTEILTLAPAPSPECTTLVVAPDGAEPFGIQTWDWHEELDPFWHTYSASGTRFAHVGLSEAGVLGKIGVNEAGLAVHFNILGHVDDAPGGVPVHVLAATILADCGSVEAALDLLASATITSSSALTVFDARSAVCAELSPGRVADLTPVDGYLLHTNHFLDRVNSIGEKWWLDVPDSRARFDLVRSRLPRSGSVADVDALPGWLSSGPGEAELCCVPSPDAALGARWRTLATVRLHPATRAVSVLDGPPTSAGTGEWRRLAAPATTEVLR